MDRRPRRSQSAAILAFLLLDQPGSARTTLPESGPAPSASACLSALRSHLRSAGLAFRSVLAAPSGDAPGLSSGIARGALRLPVREAASAERELDAVARLRPAPQAALVHRLGLRRLAQAACCPGGAAGGPILRSSGQVGLGRPTPRLSLGERRLRCRQRTGDRSPLLSGQACRIVPAAPRSRAISPATTASYFCVAGFVDAGVKRWFHVRASPEGLLGALRGRSVR